MAAASGPSPDQLLEAVRKMRVSLLAWNEDAANDPADLAARILDDHPLWTTGVDAPAVAAAMGKLKEAEVPAYVPPEALFPYEELAGGVPIPAGELLASVEKRELVGIHHAQGGIGSKGAYIIACAGKPVGLVVLKESNPAFPGEVFASNVMRAMGLHAPKFQPLSLDEYRALTWRLRSARVTVAGTCGAIHDSRAQEYGGVLMEFLRGHTLPEVGFLGDKVAPAALPTPFLKDLGTCMAVDMVLNNLDRVPIIWRNKGNATNVLMTREGGLGVIDTSYSRIEDEQNAQKHVEKVKACVADVRVGNGVNGAHAKSIRDFISESTSDRYVLSDDQVKTILASLDGAFRKLGKDHDAIFQSAARETREGFERTGVPSSWIDSSLQLDFCTACAKAMI